MIRLSLLAPALLALPFILTGCGGGEKDVETYESFFEDVLAKTNALTAEFESIKNQQSAGVAADNIVRLCNELSAIFAKSSQLPDLRSVAGLKLKKRFEEHWKERFKEAFESLETAARQAESKSGRHPSMRRVKVRMENLEKEIQNFREGYGKALGAG